MNASKEFHFEAAKLSSQSVDGNGRTNENEANAIHRRSPSTTAAKWAKKPQQNGPNRFHSSSNTNQSPSGQVMDSLIWNIWQANGNWHGRRRRR